MARTRVPNLRDIVPPRNNYTETLYPLLGQCQVGHTKALLKTVNSKTPVLSPFVRMAEARSSTELHDHSDLLLLATTVLQSYSAGTKVLAVNPPVVRPSRPDSFRGRGRPLPVVYEIIWKDQLAEYRVSCNSWKA